jgi:hypothetical protein
LASWLLSSLTVSMSSAVLPRDWYATPPCIVRRHEKSRQPPLYTVE